MAELIQKYLDDIKIQQYKTDIGFRTLMEGVVMQWIICLKLQYDVLQSRFQASNKYEYSEREIEFIEDHIKRFRLNGEREKTKQLAAFLKDTIDHQGHYTNMEYNHYIVELFVAQLKGKTREEILKICESLYIKAVMKFQAEQLDMNF